ncbi:heme ABC transporter substrate-binding protein IsdE [Adlercreutzia shanghongiae]|uniref:High-affinity heme uptake system protein IsdE n=1 Tax=Adlercreutzia shanghongiae TaxID=3111773 RepID=A0ABU6J087_9ACTN|nr:heme ABC transporter substrate-binding protein IsdE [Adlercreutzia sp. R22]MEC4295500.1 heme ABC transporter substrate-binding protein IsdE [Adlercreutzia sp. R22]
MPSGTFHTLLAEAGRRATALGLAALLAVSGALVGCVDQHPERAGDGTNAPRIIAASPAIADLCDLLHLDLVAVASTAKDLPERYQELPQVGTAIAPDLEAIKALRPDVVVSPKSLSYDLKPKYAGIAVGALFLDLRSVDGMYDSLAYLGHRFNRQESADALIAGYRSFIEQYQRSHEGKEGPRVLILMGVPGSYMVATPNSYVGSLVEQAGGVNVYADSEDEFVNVNTEDMQARDPDIILRAAHALPDDVAAMFAEEFATNDIWKHFRAVQEGHVYDLPPEQFGMSATMAYPEALETLDGMLYGATTDNEEA